MRKDTETYETQLQEVMGSQIQENCGPASEAKPPAVTTAAPEMWPHVTDTVLLSVTWLHPPARWQEAVRHRRTITTGLSLKLVPRHKSMATTKVITEQENALLTEAAGAGKTGCSPRRLKYSA